jgi:uncharacterized protein (DUF433 family)
MKNPAKTVEVNRYIVANPDICHGKLTFKDTRVMVWQVLEMLEAGESVEEILENYPALTKDHIKAALHVAAEKLAGERVVISF